MSLLRIIEQTKEAATNPLITTDVLMYELSVAGVKIILGERPLQIINGSTDFSTNPIYPKARAGEIYVSSVAGTVGASGGVVGKVVGVNDMLICIRDNDGGDETAVGTSWIVAAVSTPTRGGALHVDAASFTGNDYTPTGAFDLRGKTADVQFLIFPDKGSGGLLRETNDYTFNSGTGTITIPSGADDIRIVLL